MKNILISFLFILFSIICFSQEKNSLEIFYGNGYSNSTIVPDNRFSTTKQNSSFAHQFGVRYNSRVYENLFVGFGFTFFSNTYGISVLETPSVFSNPSGTFSIDESMYVNGKHAFWYFGLPGILSIHLPNKKNHSKLNVFLELGLIPSMHLVTQKIENLDERENQSFIKSEVVRAAQVNALLSTNFSYNFDKDFSLLLRPSFRYDLHGFLNTSSKNHYYNIGLELGLRYTNL